MIAKRSTPWMCPPVDTTIVSAGAVAPENETVVCHGASSPPAGRQHASPMGASEDAWRTWTRRFSSTPVIRPPTVTVDEHLRPVAGRVQGQVGVAGADDLPGGVVTGAEPHQVDDRGGRRARPPRPVAHADPGLAVAHVAADDLVDLPEPEVPGRERQCRGVGVEVPGLGALGRVLLPPGIGLGLRAEGPERRVPPKSAPASPFVVVRVPPPRARSGDRREARYAVRHPAVGPRATGPRAACPSPRTTPRRRRARGSRRRRPTLWPGRTRPLRRRTCRAARTLTVPSKPRARPETVNGEDTVVERLGRVDLEVVGDGSGDEPVLAVQASQGHGARDPIEPRSRLAPGVDVDFAGVGLRLAERRERRVRDVQLLAEEAPHRVERVGGQLAGRVGPEHLVGVEPAKPEPWLTTARIGPVGSWSTGAR